MSASEKAICWQVCCFPCCLPLHCCAGGCVGVPLQNRLIAITALVLLIMGSLALSGHLQLSTGGAWAMTGLGIAGSLYLALYNCIDNIRINNAPNPAAGDQFVGRR